MYKSIKQYLVLFVAIFLIIYLAAAWHFSSSVLNLPINECNQEHYVFCESPMSQGIAFEDVIYQSKDGLALPAWYMQSGESEKTVLLVHGRGASRHEGMRYAKPLLEHGYNVMAIDMRHPRQGEGIISTMSYYERNDVQGAVNYIQARTPKNDIGIMGFSMGAATSIIVMAEDTRIKTGVFNSGFANAEDVLAENAVAMHGRLMNGLIPAVMTLVELRSGMDANLINPETYIASISPRPIFIMHGTSDETVGFHHGERLFKAAKEPKEFWAVEGGEHTRLWQADRENAIQKVLDFFARTL